MSGENGQNQGAGLDCPTVGEIAGSGPPVRRRRRPAEHFGVFTRLSPTEMMAATGINLRQLQRWARDHGLPRAEDGSYSLPAFVAWLRKTIVGRPRPYRRRPRAVEKAIAARIMAIVREELRCSLPDRRQSDK